MINIPEIKRQVLLNIDREAFEKVRKSAQKDKDFVGGYAFEISNAVLKSDIRMYKREIYAFNGIYYEQFDVAVFHNMLIEVLLEMNVGYGLLVKNNIDVVDFCKKRLIQKDINTTRTMIPFNNYVLDTTNMITYPHTSTLDTLYALNYDYDPDATCPLWEKFLREVLPGDGLISILQEYLGLLFVDRDKLKLEKMLILYGSGANGKSVVFETIYGILGEQNISVYDMSQLTRGKSSEANLADIDGKMLNYSSELDPHDFSGDIVKRLISGEPIQARKLYKDPMQLKIIPLFIANANELPETSDRTKAFFRRVLIIPFNVTIEEKKQDKALSTKLRKEYSGILNWILEGTQRIMQRGINFTESKIVDKTIEEYKIIQDSVYGFVFVNKLLPSVEEGAEMYFVTNNELYKQYEKYCNDVTKKPYGKNRFLQIFKTHGFKSYSGAERGFVVYCSRKPEDYWNFDIGSIYDDENYHSVAEKVEEIPF